MLSEFKMKSYKLLFTSAVALLLSGCSDSAPDSNLKITVEGSHKTGEELCFKISGNADNIVFYSGEPGHEYNLRNRQSADNDLMVEFVSYTDQSTDIHNNFNIMVSYDFNGIYDSENVKAATWTDVTSLFILPSALKTNTSSGKVNLKDYAGDMASGPFYIAFRYYDMDNVAIKNRWVVRSINIEKISPEGQSTSLADIKTAGWQNVAVTGSGKWTLPGTQLLIAGNTATNDKDLWVISQGFDIHSAVPSTGIVLKNIATEISEYKYVYESAGTYEAVFASTSEWYNSKSESKTAVQVVIND